MRNAAIFLAELAVVLFMTYGPALPIVTPNTELSCETPFSPGFATGTGWTWTPPARADGPIPVPPGVLVFPQGMHVHEGGEEEHHCHLCHENWAARVDEKNDCPRCALHPEERTDNAVR
jgi:hypothetical protein